MKTKLVVTFITYLTIFACFCIAECKPTPVTELEAGVFELNLVDVRMKIEVFNNIIKMKMVGAVNEDWTSVNLENGFGLITGFVGNGDTAQLKAQAVGSISNGQFNLTVFKKTSLDSDEGVAYFASSEGVKCLNSEYSKWEALKTKYTPNFSSQSAINLEPDGLS